MINFIAEVSSNHSRNLDRCIDFIQSASDIGCTAVKFQLFRIDKLFAKGALPQKELMRRKNWELPLEFIPEISEVCKSKKINFSCTPFYLKAVDELEPYIDFYKIASYELLWDDLLKACAKTKKPVIISTGMANINEINHAVSLLRQNNCEPKILHCTSNYPTPINEANLSAIETIRNSTGCEVGWSDHTVNPGVIHRAIHKWNARIIEFHLDLDGMGEEFESGHCWLPEKIEKVIKEIQSIEAADGNGIKEPAKSELNERSWRADPSDGLRPFKFVRNNFKN